MENPINGSRPVLGEISSFARSLLGLGDPGTRLRALASFGASLLRVNRGVIVKGHRQVPQKTLELYEAEYCPFSRHVREALTELDLDAMIYPVPKGGKRHRQRLLKLSGKAKVPFLHDPNTGAKLHDSEAIVAYLYKEYGLAWQKVPARNLATSTLASVARAKRGMHAVANRAAKKPLELYSFEGSPYSRLTRETLCELEIPYLLHNVGKTPGSHADYLPPEYRHEYIHDYMPGTENRRKLMQRAGRVMVPYIIDPNTKTAMFETRAIDAYLRKTYGAESRKERAQAGTGRAAKAAKASPARTRSRSARA